MNSEAIDFRAASEYFAPVRKLSRNDLQSLKITALYQGWAVPTVGGVLLFGAARLNRFADAWVQARRFAGHDLRRILDSCKLRNRVLCCVYELKMIEQCGSGVQRITAACQENGFDPPDFAGIGSHFRVILSTVRRKAPAHDQRDRKILAALRKSGALGLSTAQIAKRLGISPRDARTRLASLVERGEVAEIGSGPRYTGFAISR